MQTQIAKSNTNAVTGQMFVTGLRMLDGFYGHATIGCVDAPECIVNGSFIENVISYPANHNLSDINGRYIIPSISARG